MTGSELWTTAEAAAYLGASSAGSGRKTLSRLGVAPVSREPGRAGQNLYDASQVRAARARMSGRGKRSAASALSWAVMNTGMASRRTRIGDPVPS